ASRARTTGSQRCGFRWLVETSRSKSAMALSASSNDGRKARLNVRVAVAMADPARWLTPEQAAEIVQVPPRTITELCKQGRIRGAEKWGRRWRIPPSSVQP